MKRLVTVLLGLAFALSVSAGESAHIVTAKGNFIDVKDDLVAAIEQRGLVINFTARVGEMLERTGRDLGKTRRIYEQAEVLEFCSATTSRATMETDPQNLVFCPYTIAVYTLPGKPGVVYLAHRKYPQSAALKPVTALLDGIVADVIK